MAMTFAALLQWMGARTAPPGTWKPALLGILWPELATCVHVGKRADKWGSGPGPVGGEFTAKAVPARALHCLWLPGLLP